MRFAADLRIALRALARRPASNFALVATLSVGLAGAIAVGSVAYGLLARPLPYPDADRLVRVDEVARDGHRMRMADPNFLDLARLDGAFSTLAEVNAGTVAVEVGSEPVRLGLAEVSKGYFRMLPFAPASGRLFAPAELAPGATPVALIAARLWRNRYSGERDLASLRLAIGGRPYVVVGVLPDELDFPSGTEIWIPREQEPYLPSRTAHNSRVFGRLADGATLESARTQASALAARLAGEHGDRTDMADVAVTSLAESLVAGVRPSLVLELAAAGFLLVVAIINAAALVLARMEVRRRDFATRLALGANFRQILGQMFAEAALPLAFSSAFALAAAALALRLLRRAAPAALPRLDAIRLDLPVVSLALALAAITALTLAWVAGRNARGRNLERDLRESAASLAGSKKRAWLRALPVAFQSAASVVLLVAVTLLGSSLRRLMAVEPGFRSADVLTVDLFISRPADEDAVARLGVRLVELEARLEAAPSTTAAGLVSALPVGGDAPNGTFVELASPDVVPTSLEAFEGLVHSGARTGDATYLAASEGYFHALGIPLREGRLFTATDTRQAPHVALVSESLARSTWPGQSPLGHYLEFGNMDGDVRALRIIGVVGDVRQNGLAEAPTPAIYTCFRQRPQGASSWTAVLAGAAGSPAAAETARLASRELFPDAPTRARAFEGVLAESLAERRLVLTLLAGFAVAALGLAASGVFGAVALSVAMRHREYAVRLALGADSRAVTRRALAIGVAPAAAGFVAGLALAMAASRALGGMLYGVPPRDLPSYSLAVALIAGVAIVAAWLPARRAATIEPSQALRQE